MTVTPPAGAAAERLMINVPFVPGSAAATPAATETEGAASLSVIVMFCVVVLPSTMSAEGLLIVKTAVSTASARLSSTTVKVAVPVVSPSGIVIEPPLIM